MSKITADHLSRAAYVYIRQSTASQVQHNIESQRRQYKLEHRARALGWQQVIIVDEDLGRSGGGVIRPGFERLVRAVGSGEVGAVFAVEASRLARNGRDWHTLLEFSSIVGTLIIDEDEVYDPRREIDQMVLGLKGQFSVMESSAIHRRAHEALGQMAERGELFINVAPGYVVGVEGRLVKDPDLRVREAIALVFQRFREQASARQAMLTLRADAIAMPMMACVSGRRQIAWKLPTYSWMLGVLANPIYAGAYAWGRAGREIRLKDGRRVHCTVRRPREKWPVLLHDQHEGYIDWDEYERNQTIIANNQQQAGERAQGAVRQGTALLAGLLYCGHCHGRLMVDYNKNRNGPAYYTTTPRHEKGGIPGTCVRVNSRHVDGPVVGEVLRLLGPLGIEAALAAIKADGDRDRDRRRQAELALEAARYRAGLARRQYDAVDPDNRLVAGELERRWNEQLADMQRLEAELAAQTEAASAARFAPDERERLLALGRDLPAAWDHPAAPVEIKKRILRTVIREIVVRNQDDRLMLLIHWQGGDHTELEAVRKVHGFWRNPKLAEDAEMTGRVIAALARMVPDSSIAAILNRLRHRTITGLTWNAARVEDFRTKNGIVCYRNGERGERGEMLLDEVMQELGLCKASVIRMIKTGLLPAEQVCPGIPYLIRRQDLDRPGVRPTPKIAPVSGNPHQMTLDFQ